MAARLRAAEGDLESTRQACLAVVGQLGAARTQLVQLGVDTAMGAAPADAAVALQEAVDAAAATRARAVFSGVRDLRDGLRQALLELAQDGAPSTVEVDLEAEVPLADLPQPALLSAVVAATAVARRRGWRWLGPLGAAVARRRLTAALTGPLGTGLARYADALGAWAEARIDRLGELFAAATAGCHDRLGGDALAPGTGPGADALRRDLEALQTGAPAAPIAKPGAGPCSL